MVEEKFSHRDQETTGILITNLGTPDAASAEAVRRYYREFLWDSRIVDMPRWKWWPIFQAILLLRPRKSAKLYAKIWTEQGSPLLVISQQQRDALRVALKNIFTQPVVVELGMRYGSPSIGSALAKLQQANARRILVLPLYPQYSCSTTASTLDCIADVLRGWRWVPEFRFVNQYHNQTSYIAALANSVVESWERHGQGELLLFSFHGTPKRFLLEGDPYHCMCQTTARLVAEKLGLVENRWQVTFQSIFGREEWLQPYTINTLRTLGQSGINRVDVICPGFSADCLETLEEIEQENRHAFLAAGGTQYTYIPALNTRDDHIQALVDIIVKHSAGWLDPEMRWDRLANESENIEREKRARGLGAKC